MDFTGVVGSDTVMFAIMKQNLGIGDAGHRAIKVPERQALLEGRITRILYRGPDGRSSLEILRNYQSALESAGFETLFTCGADCGNNFAALLYGPMEMRIRATDTSEVRRRWRERGAESMSRMKLMSNFR